jgi:hypothetical protein
MDIPVSNLISQIAKAVIKGSKKIKLLFIIATIIILVAIVFSVMVDAKLIPKYYNVLAGILGGIAGILILGIYAYQTNIEEDEIKEEIKKVELRVKENPNQPTAAWDLARIKLESYLNRNLIQIQWIFIWTIIVMIAGFILISYGILKVYQPNSNISAAIITTVSGLLIEFIGATFLVIYKSTMQQAKDYVNVLERINAVGMSVQILESISNEEKKLQDQTKAELSKKLLELYSLNIK